MRNFETVFAAWDGDTLAGLICAMDDGSMTAYVHYLLVRPEHQGMGIGKRLVGRVKERYGRWAPRPRPASGLTSRSTSSPYRRPSRPSWTTSPHYFGGGKPVRIGLEGLFDYEYDKGALSYNEKHVEPKNWPRAVMCGHVRGSIYVSPQGRVLPCMTFVGTPMEDRFPNMLETPLEEILDESLYMHMVDLRVSDYMEHNPECKTCEYASCCAGGCRAVAVNRHPDDYLAKDPWTCEYFRGGWRDKKDALLEELAAKGYR